MASVNDPEVGRVMRWLVVAALVGASLSACAGQSAALSASGVPRVLLLYGDGQPDDQLSLADSTYEALIRFDLKPEQGVPRRIWYRPAAPGSIQLAVYENSSLDGPGAVLEQHERAVPSDVDWTKHSGGWMVEDLTVFKPSTRPVTLWVGIKKLAETPALWCSDRDAGHYYMRSSHPQRRVSLVPVRRSPLVQLELLP